MTIDNCPARLRHNHGWSVCKEPLEHEGEHKGWCDSCVENEKDALLEWAHEHEDWTMAGPR